MFNIISGNFEISKQQISELGKEINELSQSIEYTENVLEKKGSKRGREFGTHKELYTGNVWILARSRYY